jgi:BirA family biotin operon repressor/biotin-[acetyl-CoA-carboxylase] ligase
MTGRITLPSPCTPVFFERVDSTNDSAKAMAAKGAPHLTIVVAGEQTAGKGRNGRTWISPPGNLYCSTILRPGCPLSSAAQIGFVAALATRQTIDDILHSAADVRCKWPNDVLVDGRKVSGILLESSSSTGAEVDWVVLGLGVNILLSPEPTDRPATNLISAGAHDVTAERFLEAWMPHLIDWYTKWRRDGFGHVRQAWLAQAMGRGEIINVRLGKQVLTGRFADLDPGGSLILDEPTGRRHVVSAGDVFGIGA